MAIEAKSYSHSFRIANFRLGFFFFYFIVVVIIVVLLFSRLAGYDDIPKPNFCCYFFYLFIILLFFIFFSPSICLFADAALWWSIIWRECLKHFLFIFKPSNEQYLWTVFCLDEYADTSLQLFFDYSFWKGGDEGEEQERVRKKVRGWLRNFFQVRVPIQLRAKRRSSDHHHQ